MNRARAGFWWVVKFGIAFGLLGYLGYTAWRSDQFDVLASGDIRWEWFALGFAATLVAVLITFFRWHLLARELALPLRWVDAARFGFVGYLLNFITVGTVGGDALRAFFVAAKVPGRRGEAVASVVYDRVIGLVALFVVAATALHLLKLESVAGADAGRRAILEGCRSTATVAAVIGSLVLIVFAALGEMKESWIWRRCLAIPWIGPKLTPLLSALFAYAGRPRALVIAMGLSIPVHLLNAFAVLAVASSLPIERPSVTAHLGTVPLAHLAGVLPLPGGIGAFEGTLGWLYQATAATEAAGRHGLLVAFGVRLTTIMVAMIGIGFYLAERDRIRRLESGSDKAAMTGDDGIVVETPTPLVR